MSKITLNNLANLQNETTAVNIINGNNDAIEDAMENTLSRDGETPNQMLSELDMNSNRILNLPGPIVDTEPVRLIDLNNVVLNPGNGNILGPASAVAGDVVVFAGSTGKVVADSGILATSLAPKASPTLSNPTFTGAVTSSATTITRNGLDGTGQPLTLVNNNAGAGDFLRLSNSTATNGNKTYRINSAGTIEVVNSAYSAVISSLSDAGVLSATSYQGDGSALAGVETSVHAAATYSPIIRSLNIQSGTTYTFVLADAGKLVFLGNASPVTVTIPPVASVNWPIGTQIDIINYNAGKVTLQGGSGVTIGSLASNKSLLGTYAAATLIYGGGPNFWYLMGSLTS